MGLEDKLFTIKYSPDTTSHLNADKLDCINCKNRVCEHICPAKVYEWDENNEKLIIKPQKAPLTRGFLVIVYLIFFCSFHFAL